MTPIPYLTESYVSHDDGRVYGKVTYNGAVVQEVTPKNDAGFRSIGSFDKWARGVAVDHKAAISPAEEYVIKQSFVV